MLYVRAPYGLNRRPSTSKIGQFSNMEYRYTHIDIHAQDIQDKDIKNNNAQK